MKKRTGFKVKIRRLSLVAVAALLMSAGAMPFLLGGHASAYGQLLNRSLSISSGVPGNTAVSYTFTFTLHDYTADTPPGSMSTLQSMRFIACTTAVGTYPGGTCTAPTGMDFSTAVFGSQGGTWQGAGTFSVDNVGVAGKCVPAANVLCAKRSDATTQSATSRSITFTTIKNPTTANTAFYVGIYTYSDAGYATNVDFGATASAVVQTLTTNAAVAEVLQFCVGSTTVNDVDRTNNANLIANDCAGVSGTSVDIGTLDTSAINISPVSTNGGDSNNGVAMVRSNAGNGVSISYDAIQQSGTNHLGTLRISGATCDPTNTLTDPCINAAGATQTVFTPGTEAFGMTIAGVNSNGTTSYTCQYGDTGATPSIPAGNTCHLEPTSGVNGYLGAGGSGTEDFGTSNGFAWVEDGTATTIASSAGATVKQVDDEALILKFAGTPSITTPFGRYSAQTDFIAVPVY